MVKIMVPATTANLGAGFDSFGMALSLYNIIELEVVSSGLFIDVGKTMNVPADERNLLYCSIRETLMEMGLKVPGLRIRQRNGIPVTRGLGSSAACRVGGIMAANYISGGKLSQKDMLQIATRMETHPDNVAPAIFGGFTIAYMEGKKVDCMRLDVASNMKAAVFVPDFTLQTRRSRSVLPGQVSRQDAIFNASRAAIMAAAIATGREDMLRLGAQDRLHQPYRKGMIPGFDFLVRKAYEAGAKAVFLSGAGPSVVALITQDYEKFQKAMEGYMTQKMPGWRILMEEICAKGASWEEK